MPTYTTRLGLIDPDRNESADIATIIANWNKLDGTSGLIICTEGTKPITNLFPGMYIKCTDSGKHYYYSGGSWSLNVYSGGTWIEDSYVTSTIITLTGAGSVFYGASMNKAYIYGSTAGQVSPSNIVVAANTLIDISAPYSSGSDGRNLGVTVGVSATTKLLVELSALVGCSTPTAATPPANNLYYLNTGYTTSGFSGVQFDLYDGATYICTLGRIDPDNYNSGGGYGTDFAKQSYFKKVISVASGSHNFGIRIRNITACDGSTNIYTAVHSADLTVTLSA